MVSQSIFVLAALVCCLVVVTLAKPLDDDMVMRAKRSPARRGGIKFTAARTRDAPTYASPEQDEAEEDEQEDAAADVPQKGGRGGNSDEDEEEGGDGGAPPDYSKLAGKGATAIATSYSRGKGASSNSHAIAYGGQFSGGNFRHRY